MLDSAKEEAPQERIRERIENSASFAAFRAEHPLIGRILLGICEYFDRGAEAILIRSDFEEFVRCTSIMLELGSWISGPSSATEVEQKEWFQSLLNAKVPIEQAFLWAAAPQKRRKGRPASKRRIATLALEKRMQDRERWSWMRLAMELCDCGKEKHDSFCQQRIRQEVLLLRKTLKKLGV